MSSYHILAFASVYFAILFWIASSVNGERVSVKKILSPANTFALSIAVYCTAWTFFGSVGNAAKTGINFLPVYLGPTVMMPVIVLIWMKMLRICKEYRITNIADFVSSRFGNSNSLAILVTLFYIVGIIPYIAIQLKAISNCLKVFSFDFSSANNDFNESVLYVAIILILFSILYGARTIDASEKHKGLIAAISFESIVKLIAFLVVGLYVSFFIFKNPADIIEKYEAAIQNGTLQPILSSGIDAVSWILIMLVSFLSMILLPRQFQVAIVENTDEKHLYRTVWLFPLYLLLINLFVIPIAIGGALSFGTTIDADTYVLVFPISKGNFWISILVFLGGLSAATGMVIVETIALTTMLSNSIILPIFISNRNVQEPQNISIQKIVLFTRRFGIIFIVMASYFFEKYVAERSSLISIGLISFAAVSQLAPSVLGGLYWRGATKNAAISSISVGFLIWFYTLVVPTLKGVFPFLDNIIQYGLFGVDWLKPNALLGFSTPDSLSHGIFWSLFLNVVTFVGVSIYSKQSTSEVIQSEAFVKIYSSNKNEISRRIQKNSILYKDMLYILKIFLGESKSKVLVQSLTQRYQIPIQENGWADPTLVNYSERILAGVIGPVSTHMILGNFSNVQQLSMTEVIDILKESQQTMHLNKELKKKSNELKKVTETLQVVNDQLKKADELKDEFLYTVTHELRTPLTSIRALGEILYDNPDMDEGSREKYLGVMIKETERMTHLISQVLNLERYESGRQKLHLSTFDMSELLDEISLSLSPLSQSKGIRIEKKVANTMYLVRADKDLIGQVLYNLISNAIKYADTIIEIRIVEKIDEIIVSILDNGVGIPEDKTDLIFDKFYQIKQKKLQKPDGSGLGLAISKRIIELHDQRIWVENNSPKGANFSFTLELI